MQSVTRHILLQKHKPLVLLFTGPSCHGKTELASQMGELLSLGFSKVNCPEMDVERDIFGPKAPWHGSDVGAPVNNHLSKCSGQSSVVCLEEFDKTTEDVRNALLLLFDCGFYKDRRNHGLLDCTKVIWILTANFGVDIITKFWDKHIKDRSEQRAKEAPYQDLHKSLQKYLIGSIGGPLTGRINNIIPSMPFNDQEQAVVAYKFMLTTWKLFRQSIDVEAKTLHGHVFLDFIDDGQMCQHLANQDYNPEIGARSLEQSVLRNVEGPSYDRFTEGDQEVDNTMNDGPFANFDVRLHAISGDSGNIVVKRIGVKHIWQRPVM